MLVGHCSPIRRNGGRGDFHRLQIFRWLAVSSRLMTLTVATKLRCPILCPGERKGLAAYVPREPVRYAWTREAIRGERARSPKVDSETCLTGSRVSIEARARR